MIEDRARMLLADRSYEADAVHAEITFIGIRAVIPAKRGRKAPALHSQPHYTWRNRIERIFYTLKNWRRIATRYDKPPSPTSASSPSPQRSSEAALSTRPSR